MAYTNEPCCLPSPCVQLYMEEAIVGFVCEVVEFACGVALILAKLYLDKWGPLSAGKQQAVQGNGSASALGPAALCPG